MIDVKNLCREKGLRRTPKISYAYSCVLLEKKLKGKDRIHLMKVLDKIDELELNEDFVEVLTSKFKEPYGK